MSKDVRTLAEGICNRNDEGLRRLPDANKRNLAADLEIIEAATPGPWIVDEHLSSSIRQPLGSRRRRITCPPDADGISDAKFIAEAREGWPEAIRRAVVAEDRSALMEAEIDRLRSAISDVSEKLNTLIFAVCSAGGAGQPIDAWALSSELVDIGARLQPQTGADFVVET